MGSPRNESESEGDLKKISPTPQERKPDPIRINPLKPNIDMVPTSSLKDLSSIIKNVGSKAGMQDSKFLAMTEDEIIESLTEKHTWIPHEKGFFGCAGGDYDFAAREGGAARARADLDKLERAQDKLARKINKRVMGMIEKSERDYDDLTAKKATVARDRSKIEAVISELEVKKQETLEARTPRPFLSFFLSVF